jgi:hypothetical protein
LSFTATKTPIATTTAAVRTLTNEAIDHDVLQPKGVLQENSRAGTERTQLTSRNLILTPAETALTRIFERSESVPVPTMLTLPAISENSNTDWPDITGVS